MKAIVCTRYGPPEVLQFKEIEKPVPKKNEVLIKIFASTVHIGDVRIRSFNIPGPRWQRLFARLVMGIRRPKWHVLGMELAGEIEDVGDEVVNFKSGDPVFAITMWSGFGGYAEYKCMPEDGMLALKPENLTFGQAAALPAGGFTALCVLNQAKIQPGQGVLVYGASGSVGTFAVQLAKAFGAEVTGVCSTPNVEMVRSLGADRVIDYTTEDPTRRGERYDVLFDAVDKLEASQAEKVLKEDGVYLNVDKSSNDCDRNPEDLVFLKELVEDGKLEPVIDRTFSLKEIVEAHRYVEQGHKKGNVVITIAQTTQP